MEEPILTKNATSRMLELETAIIEIAKSAPDCVGDHYPALSCAIIKGLGVINEYERP